MYYSVMTQANWEKEIPSTPQTSSDALPLSYRRLIGAKAIKLGSCEKHTLGLECQWVAYVQWKLYLVNCT